MVVIKIKLKRSRVKDKQFFCEGTSPAHLCPESVESLVEVEHPTTFADVCGATLRHRRHAATLFRRAAASMERLKRINVEQKINKFLTWFT